MGGKRLLQEEDGCPMSTGYLRGEAGHAERAATAASPFLDSQAKETGSSQSLDNESRRRILVVVGCGCRRHSLEEHARGLR